MTTVGVPMPNKICPMIKDTRRGEEQEDHENFVHIQFLVSVVQYMYIQPREKLYMSWSLRMSE